MINQKELQKEARKLADTRWGTSDLEDISEFTIPLDSAINMMVNFTESILSSEYGEGDETVIGHFKYDFKNGKETYVSHLPEDKGRCKKCNSPNGCLCEWIEPQKQEAPLSAEEFFQSREEKFTEIFYGQTDMEQSEDFINKAHMMFGLLEEFAMHQYAKQLNQRP